MPKMREDSGQASVTVLLPVRALKLQHLSPVCRQKMSSGRTNKGSWRSDPAGVWWIVLYHQYKQHTLNRESDCFRGSLPVPWRLTHLSQSPEDSHFVSFAGTSSRLLLFSIVSYSAMGNSVSHNAYILPLTSLP